MTVPTFTASIFIGLKRGYTGKEMTVQEVEDFLQEKVDKIGLCVSITPTRYVYTNGNENGLIIGLINYPRFPSDEYKIRMCALELAGDLMLFCKQMRVCVVFPDKTIMLSNSEEIEKVK
jgi:hypothetical protein